MIFSKALLKLSCLGVIEGKGLDASVEFSADGGAGRKLSRTGAFIAAVSVSGMGGNCEVLPGILGEN